VTEHPGSQPRNTRRVQPSEGEPAGTGRPGPGARQPAPPSLDVLAAEFAQVLKSNETRFAELDAQGVAPDPFYLVHARINHLIDSIAQFAGANGQRWAVMTRLGFEKYIAAELARVGSATTRMRLAEGSRYTPEMIRALALQNRTFRHPH
jgi:hypothetical protein